MIKNTFLGLGPMSLEVINSLNYFSKKYKKKIMLICSRNQIESEKYEVDRVKKLSELITDVFNEVNDDIRL